MKSTFNVSHLGFAAILILVVSRGVAEQPGQTTFNPQLILKGLQDFYQKTARPDGSFQPGVDPDYLGMSDSAYSDLAPVTYACTIHSTFGWQLPYQQKTIEFLLSRQKPSGEFVNVAGTVDPQSPQGRTYNTTQALVALRALQVKPRFDPLPVFEEILKQDYKTLPAYSTSFFPLAYLCYGKPIPEQADRAIRALMIQDDDGYLNDHIAATFHASHYYRLVGETTPKSEQMVARALRDQRPDGSWFLNLPSRDRHATFDAVFTLRHEGPDREDCRAAIQRAAQWALSCRNADGAFGHFPGSASDADATYFQVGTLVMAGVLQPASPLPKDPKLLSWGHLIPLRKPSAADRVKLSLAGWIGSVAFSPDGQTVATGDSSCETRLWDSRTGKSLGSLPGHTDCVASVAFSSDGTALVTGSFDQTAKIWDIRSQKVIHTLNGHRGAVMSVVYAPKGDTVATAGIDQSIRLWNAKTGKHVRMLSGHKSWVNSIAFTPNGELLVSGSSDGTVKVWSVASGQLSKTIVATPAEVRSVAVSPNGKFVAAGIRYGVIKVWETDGWSEYKKWESPADDVWSVIFSSDSQGLYGAAGEWNRPTAVTLWTISDARPIAQFKHTGEVLSLALSPDGKTLAAGGGDKAVSIWHMAEPK